jgi:hypothetical protein
MSHQTEFRVFFGGLPRRLAGTELCLAIVKVSLVEVNVAVEEDRQFFLLLSLTMSRE